MAADPLPSADHDADAAEPVARMRLTQYADYGLRVLTYLALQPDRFGTVQAIAERFDVSRHHLVKVVQELQQRGYIDTTRGRNGGMRLRLPTRRINIGRVVRDLENDLALVECFGSDNRCIISPACALRTIFAQAQDAFFAVLDGYTLADLVADPKILRRIIEVRSLDDAV